MATSLSGVAARQRMFRGAARSLHSGSTAEGQIALGRKTTPDVVTADLVRACMLSPS
ncbi:MAG TPA: hypothetical protein VM925_27805 [Labilithrix sp.]|nr:hypothetical protein [Labilithrix sp.]